MYQDAAQRQVCQLATQLYADRHDYLLAIARQNAHTETDAEEALQEAFASFLSKFDPERGAPPLAWLTLYADLCVMPTRPREPALQAGAAG